MRRAHSNNYCGAVLACQLGGWTLAALFWSCQAYFKGSFRVGIAALYLLLDVVIGIACTNSIRSAKPWNGCSTSIATVSQTEST